MLLSCQRFVRFRHNPPGTTHVVLFVALVTFSGCAHRETDSPRVLCSDSGPIYDLALSPDGAFLLEGTGAHDARIWNLNDCREVVILSGNDDPVFSVAFSHDGRFAIASGPRADGGSSETFFWDITSLNRAYIVAKQSKPRPEVWRPGPTNPVTILRSEGQSFRARISPRGQLIAVLGNAVHIYDMKNGAPTERIAIKAHRYGTWDAAFSPDEELLATCGLDLPIEPNSLNRQKPFGDSASIRIWSLKTGRELSKFCLSGDSMRGLAFLGTGKSIIVGCNCDKSGKFLLWNFGDSDLVRSEPLGSLITALSVSPDEKTIAVGANENIELRSMESFKVVATLSGHRDQINALKFAPDQKRLYSAGYDGRILIWDLPCSSTSQR
jgi:WD40 repeat protein